MSYDYYKDNLSAEKLRRVYEIATPRIRQYLKAEMDFVKKHINPNDTVIELGCGYGRALAELAYDCRALYGIDNSPANIHDARSYLNRFPDIHLAVMDAGNTGFDCYTSDVTICIQNGISAFHIEPANLIRETLRITKPGGVVLFSSYAEQFWADRLEWFDLQSREGLLGEIDYDKTGGGQIVCKDGFTATTYTVSDLENLTSRLDLNTHIEIVDNSSIFCVIRPR